MSFKSLKPTVSAQLRKRFAGETVFSTLYIDTLHYAEQGIKGRPPELRPSSFPICPILNWLAFTERANTGVWKSSNSLVGEYFTTLGTAVHSMVQQYIGHTGKIWGNWKCINPDCSIGLKGLDRIDKRGRTIIGKTSTFHTTENRCAECGSLMEYVEIEVVLNGVKGHIDCIIYLGKGKYWVGDYKTTTGNKINSDKLPHKSHLKQVPTYVYMLRESLKLNVVGFSLLYISRDNPFKFQEKHYHWSKKWNLKIKLMIRDERIRYKASLLDFKNKEVDQIIKKKLCCSREFYDEHVDYYTPCPLLDVCFKRAELNKTLQTHLDKFPYSKSKADVIYKELAEKIQ